MEPVRMLVEQSLGIQFLLEPATGSIIAASRGASDLLPACHTREPNAYSGNSDTNLDGSIGAGKDDTMATDVLYMHQFLLRHTADTWQNAIEPLLRGSKELITIAAYLVDPSSVDEQTHNATNPVMNRKRQNSCASSEDLTARAELPFAGEEVYIDVQMHCRCLLAIAHPTAKYWQKLGTSETRQCWLPPFGLLKDEFLFQEILDLLPDLVYAKYVQGRMLLANKAMGDAYGVSVEELLHSNLHSVQEMVDRPQEEQVLREEEKDASWSAEVRKAGEQMAAKGEEVRRGDGVRLLGVEREVMESGLMKVVEEEEFTTSTGEERIYRTVRVPYTRPVTGCKAVIGIARDVTAQVQQREILAQGEQRHRAQFDLIGVGTLTLASENHCITSCSKGVTQILGLIQEELVGKPLADFLHPTHLEEFQAACRAFLHSSSSPEKRYQVEGQYIRASRAPIWIRLTLSQIEEGHPPDPPFVTCMVEDITVSREAQKELRLALDRISAIVPKLDFQGEYTLGKALDAIPGMIQKYKTLFELSIDPLLVVSSDWHIVDCNQAAIKMAKYSSKEAIAGKHVRIFYPPTQPNGMCSEDVASAACSKLESRQEVSLEFNQLAADGTTFLCAVQARRVVLNKQELSLCVWHNLEGVRAVESELRKAKEEAEAASQAKGQFLASMSHEIRTPMNGVLGVAELLLKTPLSEEQRMYLEIIKSSGDSLLHIINDVLDLSKIEAHNLALEWLPFNVKEQLKEALALLEVVAGEKGLELTSVCSPEVPEWVVGDVNRIRQVLLNLVSNALKFTKQGGIEVKVRLASPKEEQEALAHRELREALLEQEMERKQERGGGKKSGSFVRVYSEEFQLQSTSRGGPTCEAEQVVLLVEVVDTGLGISQEVAANIFSAFVQGDSSTCRKYGGTGLGLAISKSLVSLMGGHIGVRSRVGVGSTFFFTLCLGKAEPSFIETTQPRKRLRSIPSIAALKGITCLLVEDNKVNQLVAVRMLKALGVVCDVADNGVEAVEACKKCLYDIVLMDCHMPEMDGFEATVKIRELPVPPGSKRPTIVALTASVLSHERKRCKEVGMDVFLTKPIRPADFEAFLLDKVSNRDTNQ